MIKLNRYQPQEVVHVKMLKRASRRDRDTWHRSERVKQLSREMPVLWALYHKLLKVTYCSVSARSQVTIPHQTLWCLTFPRMPCPTELLLMASLLALFASVRAPWFPRLSKKLQPTVDTSQLGRCDFLVPWQSGRPLSVLERLDLLGSVLWSVLDRLPMPEPEGDIMAIRYTIWYRCVGTSLMKRINRVFLCHSLATQQSYPVLLKMCLRVRVRVTVGLRLEKLELGLSYLILLNMCLMLWKSMFWPSLPKSNQVVFLNVTKFLAP